MNTVLIALVFIVLWNLLISLLQKSSGLKHKSFVLYILNLIFNKTTSTGSSEISNQKEVSIENEHLLKECSLNYLLANRDIEYSFFIKPEYSIFVEKNPNTSRSLNIMGTSISLQLSENESLTLVTGLLDEAISHTSNLNPNEASSVISSSIPKCVISSTDIHAICHQIKSLAAKYRFDPAKFENFIHR